MNLKRDFDAVAAWGITVTLAYLLTPYIKALGLSFIGLNYQILIMWSLFMAVPVYYSYKEAKGPLGWKTLNPIWAIVVVIGILGNFAGEMFLTGEALSYSYYQKWFFLPAVLLAYTAYEMDGTSRFIYAGSTLANVIAGGFLFVSPSFKLYAFQVAALIQGVPILADWYVRKS